MAFLLTSFSPLLPICFSLSSDVGNQPFLHLYLYSYFSCVFLCVFQQHTKITFVIEWTFQKKLLFSFSVFKYYHFLLAQWAVLFRKGFEKKKRNKGEEVKRKVGWWIRGKEIHVKLLTAVIINIKLLAVFFFFFFESCLRTGWYLLVSPVDSDGILGCNCCFWESTGNMGTFQVTVYCCYNREKKKIKNKRIEIFCWRDVVGE